MIEKRDQQLRSVGLETVCLGQKIVVLPSAGRVIALYPAENQNVLWVNPAVNEPASLAATLRSSEWANLGGDRTWISPEVETHIGDPTRMAETYAVPKEVDPGHYCVVSQDARTTRLTAEMTIAFLRSEVDVSLRLSKTISLLDTPAVQISDAVGFAGYRLETSLEAIGELPPQVHPGIWNLAQVPRGGTIYVPVHGVVSAKPFIGQPTWESKHGLIQIQALAEKPIKLSIHSRDSRGMLIHERAVDDRAALVIRRFSVAPPARYFDAPCDDLNDVGYMAQVYVDDGGLGDFAELEYHSPGLDMDAGVHCLSDTSDVLAFVGPPTEIHELLGSLLRAGNPARPQRQLLDNQTGGNGK